MALCIVTVPALCTEPGPFSGLIHIYQMTTSFSAQLSCWLLPRNLVSYFLSWVRILCVCVCAYVCTRVCLYVSFRLQAPWRTNSILFVCVGPHPLSGLNRMKAPIVMFLSYQGPGVSRSTTLSGGLGGHRFFPLLPLAGAASALHQWDSEQCCLVSQV